VSQVRHSLKAQVAERAASVAAHAEELAAMPRARIVRALSSACRAIGDSTSPAGRDAPKVLAEATGLSQPMVEWALRTAVCSVDEEALSAVLATLPDASGLDGRPAVVARPVRLTVVILAGNVFTASLKAIALPLLAQSPVLAKVSSREDVFPRILRRALTDADRDVAECFDLLTFEGGDEELEGALFQQADVVSAFGGDGTLASIRARLGGTTTFVPHGHGLGAVFVPASALDREDELELLVEEIALDVAAYDQRGCLSPHTVFVERGARVSGRDVAHALAAHGLDTIARRLPRGELPFEAAATQIQWRGVAAARGELFEGDGYAVACETQNPRLSPGYRNVSVLEIADEAALHHWLLPYGMHLKALGVAGGIDLRRGVAARLPPPLAPRVSQVGQMQTPPFGSIADGSLPWTGLVRLAQVD
jgi:hypothetical protein